MALSILGLRKYSHTFTRHVHCSPETGHTHTSSRTRALLTWNSEQSRTACTTGMGLSILKVKGCLETGNLGATNVLVVATTYQKSQPMLSCRMVVRVSGPGPAENYRSARQVYTARHSMSSAWLYRQTWPRCLRACNGSCCWHFPQICSCGKAISTANQCISTWPGIASCADRIA